VFRKRVLGRLVAVGMSLGALTVGTAPMAHATEAQTVCTIRDTGLNEISGMAYSGLHDEVLWVHNDSGGGPRIYALDTNTCNVVATLRITGIEARDFEAMGVGVDERGRSVIWVADIGDNTAERKRVYLHRIVEPSDLVDQKVSAETFAVRYETPADAEAIVVDDTAVWIVTKGLAAGTVEQLTLPLSARSANRAESVGIEEGLVTDAAMDPLGDRYVVRDYTEARIYSGTPPGTLLTRLPLPDQVQGEAVTWTPDGSALIIASENDDRILRVSLPAEATPPTPPTPSESAELQTTTPDPAPTEQAGASDDSVAPAQTTASAVLEPAEQLGSLSLLALAVSGGVFLVATIGVIAYVLVRDRRRA
jgi:DNA-binding beta-propeller fold protein YncE